MKIVIQDQFKNSVIELPEESFKKILIEYVNKFKDAGKAFDEIAKELKKRTLVV